MHSNRLPRAVFLYPDHAAEDDYPRAASLIEVPVELEVVHTTIGEDAHRVDALLDTGDVSRLRAALDGVDRDRLASVVWACTSGSFVFGLDGARAQAEALAETAGVPASSTSLAFVDALAALGVREVAIAATYPRDIVELFVEFLAAAGVQTHGSAGLGIVTGAEVGTLEAADVVRLAQANDAAVDAVLLPDTALHTIAHLQRLEKAVGKPVLTANQVTVWQGLRLAGAGVPRCPALGQLFDVAIGVT